MTPADIALGRLHAMLDASAETGWVLESGTVRRLDASGESEGEGEPLAAWIASQGQAGRGVREAVERGLAALRPFSIDPAEGSGRWRFLPVPGRGEGPAEWLVLAGRRVEGRGADQASPQRGPETLRQVRNTLAVVRAIIRRSASSEDGTETFARRLDERIAAVARVRSALARSASPDLEALLRDELMAVQADEGRVSIGGPRVPLSARLAETLALAVHELAANAVEHGSLSLPGGRVEITWTVMPGAEEGWLRLAWSESGGPERLVPSRRGFGTDVIEHMLPYDLGALTTLTFGVHGVTCRMEIPMPLRDAGPLPLQPGPGDGARGHAGPGHDGVEPS